MRTISYRTTEWNNIWDRLARDYSALSMGKMLGFSLRKESKMLNCDDAPVGVEEIIVHLDFERDEDYTMFLLKFYNDL